MIKAIIEKLRMTYSQRDSFFVWMHEVFKRAQSYNPTKIYVYVSDDQLEYLKNEDLISTAVDFGTGDRKYTIKSSGIPIIPNNYTQMVIKGFTDTNIEKTMSCSYPLFSEFR